MSCNYAEGLSSYENKGKLGLPEKFDGIEEVRRKSSLLCEWMKKSKHTVVHTGAGISTSAGIPDFRGPNGVWTLEEKGCKPSINISWEDAIPTSTHMALVALHKAGYISYIITQNIDGLHLRSGISRSVLSELHGNMFVDCCSTCQRKVVRAVAASTVGQKTQNVPCPFSKNGGRKCRGKLYDTILDWEDDLPDTDLEMAILHSHCAELSLCLGTTLQIVPSGNLPVDTKKRGGKLIICNLQPTKQDRHADLIINTYVDDLMQLVLQGLGVDSIEYSEENDPTKLTQKILNGFHFNFPIEKSSSKTWPLDFVAVEWTLPGSLCKDKHLVTNAKQRKVIKAKRKSCTGGHQNESSSVQENQRLQMQNCLKKEELHNAIVDAFDQTSNSLENKLNENIKPKQPKVELDEESLTTNPIVRDSLTTKFKSESEDIKSNINGFIDNMDTPVYAYK